MDELLQRKSDVCDQLQRTVVNFCQQTYTGTTVNDFEVDGIICITFSNSFEQHVVKIHEKLTNGQNSISDCQTDKSHKTDGFVLGNYGRVSSSQFEKKGTDETFSTLVIDALSDGEQEMVSEQFNCNRFVEPCKAQTTCNFEVKSPEKKVGRELTRPNSRNDSENETWKLLSEESGGDSKKKKFVESVEGEYVIVKVEADESDSDGDHENVGDTSNKCYSNSIISKSYSDSADKESCRQEDCMERLSVVGDSGDTMYMVTDNFASGNTDAVMEDYPYQPSISKRKIRDSHKFVPKRSPPFDKDHISDMNMSDLHLYRNQHPCVNSKNAAGTGICQETGIVSEQMSKKNWKNTSSNHNEKSGDFDQSVFPNFNVSIVPSDSIPVPQSVKLLSPTKSNGSDASHNMQLSATSDLSSKYYAREVNTSGSFIASSSRPNIYSGLNSKLPQSVLRSQGCRGRNALSSMSHPKRTASISAARSLNIASKSKQVKKSQKLFLKGDFDSKTQSATLSATDSVLPSQSKFIYDQVDPMERDKAYFCRYCGKGFTMKCTRSRHEKTICSPAGVGSYKCEICNKEFTRSDSRYRHMFKSHGIRSLSLN